MHLGAFVPVEEVQRELGPDHVGLVEALLLLQERKTAISQF